MRKKILHIQVFPKLSGVQKVSLEILSALSNNEFEKHIIFSNELDSGDRSKCEQAFKEAGVIVHYLPSLKRAIGFSDIKATRDLFRYIRKEKFDIVHTNSTKPGIVGRIAAWLARTPLIIHTVHGLAFHNFVRFPKWQFYWLCEMFASCFCDKICVVNKYYTRNFRWFKRKVKTIYNGVDFKQFAYPGKYREDDGKIKVLSVGRLDVAKDPLTLLQAAKFVIEKNPNIYFTLVGDGQFFDECRKFIKESGIEGNVEMVGWHQNVEDYYSTHDIFANSSIYEAFGLIFVEAGFYNLPTVTTNVEGIPEVVKDGVTGLLCNPRDPLSLAQNILTLASNTDSRRRMGQNAFDYVTRNFDSERMVKAYLKLYTD